MGWVGDNDIKICLEFVHVYGDSAISLPSQSCFLTMLFSSLGKSEIFFYKETLC